MEKVHRYHSDASRAFTLLEMIISVALVLVLMLAVTKIFSITGSAVGASQGISAATRDARAAQTVFSQDIGAMANDSPFVVISSNYLAAFRSKSDQQADRDGNPLTIDLDGDATEGNSNGEDLTNVIAANSRKHRQDVFTFCARDRYHRQTGNDGTLVDNMSAPEAMIWYGHLSIAGNDGKAVLPGDPTVSNPNNFFASQWVLGRTATLMVEPGADGNINDSGGNPQYYYGRTTNTTLKPLAVGSTVLGGGQGYPSPTTQPTIQAGRFDLAGVSIQTFRQNLSKIISSGAVPPLTAPWYTLLNTNPAPNVANANVTRFQANPFLSKPINSASSAQQVPLFVPGCSQFIVEYAGDFIAQDQYGNPQFNTTALITPSGGGTAKYPLADPDGQIDFTYNPTTGQKSIQWYGAPRSPAGNTTISPLTGDVVPLANFIHYAAARKNTANSFTPNSDTKTTFDTYNDLITVGFDPFERYLAGQNLDSLANSFTTPYFAAWGPDSGVNTQIPRAKLYRITLVIDRPEMAGRMSDGQTFEYIFNAP